MKFLSSARLERVRTRYGIFAILLLALAIGLYRLGARTWHGDELGSLGDAQDLQHNLQALSYFVLLRAWLLGGTGEFWSRALSLFFTVLAIAVLFVTIKRQWGTQTALIASLLLATAPFVENYSQQVRYYSLFLFAACLDYWAFFAYFTNPSRRKAIYWGLATLFLLSTHAMSFLLVLSQAATLFLVSPRWTQRQKLATVGIVVILSLLLLVTPIKALAFNALAYYTDAKATFSESRGLSLTQVSKIPGTLYFFTLGESVYPFDLKLVAPAILFYGIALVLGLSQLRRHPSFQLFVTISATLSLIMLYLFFDALIPSTFGGAAPRYIIFLLPLYFLIVAIGTQRKRMQWLVAPLLFLNLGSLGSYWCGDWSYTDDLINWRTVTQWVSGYVTPETFVLADGRSNVMAGYYFPAEWNHQATWTFESPKDLRLDQYPRIIFLSYDFHTDRREFASALMQHLESGYDKTAVWTQYPLFIYIFDQKRNSLDTFPVNTSGDVGTPAEIYGLEFQDLTLPIHLAFNSHVLQSSGAFPLPTFDGRSSRVISLAEPKLTNKILLFSNLTDADKLASGTPIANLLVHSETGTVQTLALRLGYETSGWNQSCIAGGCKKAFTWRKLFALLGSERYPESWQEFDASIFGAELNLSQPTQIHSFEFQSVSRRNTFYVWGIAVEP